MCMAYVNNVGIICVVNVIIEVAVALAVYVAEPNSSLPNHIHTPR